MKGADLFWLCIIYSIPIMLLLALFTFSPILGMIVALLCLAR